MEEDAEIGSEEDLLDDDYYYEEEDDETDSDVIWILLLSFHMKMHPSMFSYWGLVQLRGLDMRLSLVGPTKIKACKFLKAQYIMITVM